jgi:hypothetical protein
LYILIFRFCLIKHHNMKVYGGGGISPCILNLGTRWRWLASRPGLYSRGKKPWHPLDGFLPGVEPVFST